MSKHAPQLVSLVHGKSCQRASCLTIVFFMQKGPSPTKTRRSLFSATEVRICWSKSNTWTGIWTRSRDLTPLFCAKVVTGSVIAQAERKQLKPSASKAPWILRLCLGPAVWMPDTSAVAVTCRPTSLWGAAVLPRDEKPQENQQQHDSAEHNQCKTHLLRGCIEKG